MFDTSVSNFQVDFHSLPTAYTFSITNVYSEDYQFGILKKKFLINYSNNAYRPTHKELGMGTSLLLLDHHGPDRSLITPLAWSASSNASQPDHFDERVYIAYLQG